MIRERLDGHQIQNLVYLLIIKKKTFKSTFFFKVILLKKNTFKGYFLNSVLLKLFC